MDESCYDPAVDDLFRSVKRSNRRTAHRGNGLDFDQDVFGEGFDGYAGACGLRGEIGSVDGVECRKIVHVGGPVVDVEFDGTHLPKIKDALILDNPNDQRVMEVASHLGDNTVRCIMLQSSDGLYKGMKVVSTGSPIKVPVGKKTLGRLFNVTG